ncbi:hypothetical protein BS17DRAFT_6518 [Gyrodon lividus]|nr:hypothetical protein BS17DRAFT_6518 [Gyrodon lividus]
MWVERIPRHTIRLLIQLCSLHISAIRGFPGGVHGGTPFESWCIEFHVFAIAYQWLDCGRDGKPLVVHRSKTRICSTCRSSICGTLEKPKNPVPPEYRPRVAMIAALSFSMF